MLQSAKFGPFSRGGVFASKNLPCP